MIVQRIPRERLQEFGKELGLEAEDMQHLTQAQPQDKHNILNDIIQQWLRRKPGEAQLTLAKVLASMKLHAIASLLQQSDSDSQWLK